MQIQKTISNYSYLIRFAKSHELKLLPVIEQAAGELFRKTPYPEIADGENPSEHINPQRDKVWIAVNKTDQQPVGFAIAYLYDEMIHLHELDVHPAHGRRGIGRGLIDTVAAWGRKQGAKAMTLTTFADVPWNGPYYKRLGFRVLNPDELTTTLLAILQEEKEAGLATQNRICMQLDI